MRLYYCKARTSNAVELAMRDREFHKNGLILKYFTEHMSLSQQAARALEKAKVTADTNVLT